jgi:hypothetical protein
MAPAASVTDARVSSGREVDHGSRQRYLIADQLNNRAIEVDRAHRIVATFTGLTPPRDEEEDGA